MDPMVQSYQDSLLRRSDVALLNGPHWLNDQVIGFAFEYFATDRFKNVGENFCFISPEVAQFIKYASCQEELAIFLEPLNLASRRWVFLAVKDNSNQTASGSHWSLLLYRRDTDQFSHYDSQSGSNSLHARHIAAKLEAFLGTGVKVPFVEEQSPSQQNSYDCGMYSADQKFGDIAVFGVFDEQRKLLSGTLEIVVFPSFWSVLYVICNAEALCESARVEGCPQLPAQIITPTYITQKRTEWYSLIQRLAKE